MADVIPYTSGKATTKKRSANIITTGFTVVALSFALYLAKVLLVNARYMEITMRIKVLKKIGIIEAMGIKGYSNEVINQIVQTLISEGLIKPGNREDEVKITYEWKHKKSKS